MPSCEDRFVKTLNPLSLFFVRSLISPFYDASNDPRVWGKTRHHRNVNSRCPIRRYEICLWWNCSSHHLRCFFSNSRRTNWIVSKMGIGYWHTMSSWSWSWLLNVLVSGTPAPLDPAVLAQAEDFPLPPNFEADAAAVSAVTSQDATAASGSGSNASFGSAIKTELKVPKWLKLSSMFFWYVILRRYW